MIDSYEDPVRRLLVIDDDAGVGGFIASCAQRAGFAPTVTTTFDEFVAAYDDGVSVIVIDLVMPEVDGIEVMRYLSSRGSSAGIVITSGLDARVMRSAVQLGTERGLQVIGSLGKPFSFTELTGLLRAGVPPLTPVRDEPTPEPAPDDLRRGLEEGELTVNFQPKVDMRSRELVGVEAVARWEHPELGTLSPCSFIGLAEDEGLMGRLTDRVMDVTFSQRAAWAAAGFPVHVAVNISATSLDLLDLPDRIESNAARHGVEPRHVTIEVTESSLADDAITAIDILTRIRLKGFELSIDDFGTGYSTLQQLKRLPFTELKVDQSFVHHAAGDDEALAIAESSVELGHALRLRVVAEGIERPDQWDLMARLGCDQAQGHLIAKPMPGEEIPGWLERWG